MNAFTEHHKDSIRFGYRCFDRILLNGLIQPFRNPSACSVSSMPTAEPRGADWRRRSLSRETLEW
jgi:hypothetical protein